MVNQNITIKFGKGKINYEAINMLIKDVIKDVCLKHPVYPDKVSLPVNEFMEFYIYGKEFENMGNRDRVIMAMGDIVGDFFKLKNDFENNEIDRELFETKKNEYLSKTYFLKTYVDENILTLKK
jgi:hypothetical protein